MKKYTLLLLILCLSFLTVSAESETEQEMEKLITTLLKTRQEVELANTMLVSKKEEIDQKLKNQGMTIADLENQIKREQKIIAQNEENKQAILKTLNLSQENQKQYAPFIAELIGGLRSYIKNSLPYARDKRLEALQELEKKYQNSRYTDVQMLGQLWQFIEDETRLTKENSLQQQIVNKDNELQQLELAKIGMWQMYYKTANGDLGIVKTQAGIDQFIPLKNAKEQTLVLNFMDSMRKNIRTGQFHLPLIIDEVL